MISGVCLAISSSWAVYQWLPPISDDPIGYGHFGASFVNWDSRRDQVKQAFVTSWDAYARHAWGE